MDERGPPAGKVSACWIYLHVMNITKIDLKKGLRWPHQCAYCNGPATSSAATRFRVIDGFFIVAMQETTHSIDFPVCKRHRWPAKFYGWVSNQAMPTGFCMALLLPLVVTLALAALTPLKFDDVTFVATCAATPFIVMYLKLRNPVKVLGVKHNVATFRILNAEYAAAFNALNATQGQPK